MFVKANQKLPESRCTDSESLVAYASLALNGKSCGIHQEIRKLPLPGEGLMARVDDLKEAQNFSYVVL